MSFGGTEVATVLSLKYEIGRYRTGRHASPHMSEQKILENGARKHSSFSIARARLGTGLKMSESSSGITVGELE